MLHNRGRLFELFNKALLPSALYGTQQLGLQPQGIF
jgi:hypothetical protein